MSMVYRIRYKEPKSAAEAEVLVQANSPTEALVKFRHSHSDGIDSPQPKELVTSVYAEYYGDDSPW
ncbi:MAG TPA: hypothetical protein VM098_08715 [Phycisphaerae bacterium]|nr:hypothetical protein [Phycisphaerae bacterium]